MNTTREFDIVVAVDAAGGIGKDGDLPWHLPGDLAFFKRVTTETRHAEKTNAVIMGRRTWDSIPPKYRPLPRRRNIVLTRNPAFQAPEADRVCPSLEAALEAAAGQPDTERIFVVGGAQIYADAIDHPGCRAVYLTRIEESYDCDTFFPELGEDYVEAERSEENVEGGVAYRFLVFRRR